jgi:hypothetical protein
MVPGSVAKIVFRAYCKDTLFKPIKVGKGYTPVLKMPSSLKNSM